MFCSHPTCLKEVDINSVMKQETSGGFTLNTEFTTNTYYAGRTTNKLINVCKSCGNTEYLWETKKDYDEYRAEEEEKERIREEKELEIKRQTDPKYIHEDLLNKISELNNSDKSFHTSKLNKEDLETYRENQRKIYKKQKELEEAQLTEEQKELRRRRFNSPGKHAIELGAIWLLVFTVIIFFILKLFFDIETPLLISIAAAFVVSVIISLIEYKGILNDLSKQDATRNLKVGDIINFKTASGININNFKIESMNENFIYSGSRQYNLSEIKSITKQ